MIRIAQDQVVSFIKWLNERYGTDSDVYLSILHGYDTIECGSGQGFAVFTPLEDKPMICIAGDSIEGVDPVELMCTSIAHEYMHFIQFLEKRLPHKENKRSEKEAETFAVKAWDEFNKGK